MILNNHMKILSQSINEKKSITMRNNQQQNNPQNGHKISTL